MSGAAWLAGSTRRWHTNPHFAGTDDRVDGHSARVAILILQLWPDASGELLRAAIVHDLGEYAVGDMARPVKRKRPDLYAEIEALEGEALAEMGLAFPELPAKDAARLAFCDALDSYLWALFHGPEYVARNEAWCAMRRGLRERAEAFGVSVGFHRIVTGVSDGRF